MSSAIQKNELSSNSQTILRPTHACLFFKLKVFEKKPGNLLCCIVDSSIPTTSMIHHH